MAANYQGNDSTVQRILDDVLEALPNDVRKFATEQIVFFAIGPGTGQGQAFRMRHAQPVWGDDAWLVLLGEQRLLDPVQGPGLVAHEVAHCWLEEGQPVSHPEIAALAHKWGFHGFSTNPTNF